MPGVNASVEGNLVGSIATCNMQSPIRQILAEPCVLDAQIRPFFAVGPRKGGRFAGGTVHGP